MGARLRIAAGDWVIHRPPRGRACQKQRIIPSFPPPPAADPDGRQHGCGHKFNRIVKTTLNPGSITIQRSARFTTLAWRGNDA